MWEEYWKYSITLNRTGTIEMAKWCKENCPEPFYGADTSVIWSFRNEEDAMAFKLRWL